MENNNDKEFVLANIPSEKPYYINKFGEVIGAQGRQLKSGNGSNKKTITFRNLEGKLEQLTFLKIIWSTYFPEDKINRHDVFKIKDETLENKFHPSNLLKTSKKEIANQMTINRTLTKERKLVIDFIKENGSATKSQLFDLLELKDRKNGIHILSNLITKMKQEKSIYGASIAVYKLVEQ